MFNVAILTILTIWNKLSLLLLLSSQQIFHYLETETKCIESFSTKQKVFFSLHILVHKHTHTHIMYPFACWRNKYVKKTKGVNENECSKEKEKKKLETNSETKKKSNVIFIEYHSIFYIIKSMNPGFQKTKKKK